MPRRRRGFFDDFFREIDELFERMEEEMGFKELGEGFGRSYSITVTYDDNGKPVVRVSARGDVDRREIEEYIRMRYPDAKITWEGEERRVKEHIKEVEEFNATERRLGTSEVVKTGSRKPKIQEMKVEEGEEKRGREIKVE
ncbi:MAG: hypothetical protein N3F04_00870 [Candidatus Nezhaarchaeota archaeon]|nr:hypothetical protein [Candidatus Nezhaarchaeota archaeon]MCX8141328.1 hypothetical protein [Candidatus Nezhaarchaeota archaeon]MDW8049594.1 hypothetical protein [Nitrososphaerota archaeon]